MQKLLCAYRHFDLTQRLCLNNINATFLDHLLVQIKNQLIAAINSKYKNNIIANLIKRYEFSCKKKNKYKKSKVSLYIPFVKYLN